MKINDVELNTDCEQILSDLQQQLSLNGIELLQKTKNSGNDIMVQCPYHGNGQERRPSAGIRKSDGMFHCFACGETHSLAEVISHCFGKDTTGVFGWKWLLQNYGTVKVEERKDLNLLMERRNDKIKRDDEQIEYVSEEELDSYRYYHPYMYKRGLTDEVIERFDIGFDSNTDCITFPVRDVQGRTLFIARRSVNSKYFNYPQGVEKPLYGLYELSRLEKFPDEIYVCESMLDALTIWCYNKYAVALNGLGNELSIAQIKKLPCRKVILATDKDDAGKKARIRLRKELNNKIVTELDYRTYPDHAKDMNDMTREEFYVLGEVF